MSEPRTVSLFRNGRSQALRIPKEFEFPGTEVTVRKDGDQLIISQKKAKKTLAEVLAEMEAIPDFPDIDDGDLPPLRDVEL